MVITWAVGIHQKNSVAIEICLGMIFFIPITQRVHTVAKNQALDVSITVMIIIIVNHAAIMPQNLSPEATISIVLAVILILVFICCLVFVFCCVYLLRSGRSYIIINQYVRRTSII